MKALRWQVTDQLGDDHVVELPTFRMDPPRHFLADGQRESLGGYIHPGPRHAEFRLGPSAASMTMRLVTAKPDLRRAWREGFRPRNFAKRFVETAIGGPGLAGGLAAAEAAGKLVRWVIYSLEVDEVAQGAWVVRLVGGVAASATFVEPGGALPDGKNERWPQP